jgi:hypothetical protein
MLQHHDAHVPPQFLRFSAASCAADVAPEALTALVMVTLLSAGMMSLSALLCVSYVQIRLLMVAANQAALLHAS